MGAARRPKLPQARPEAEENDCEDDGDADVDGVTQLIFLQESPQTKLMNLPVRATVFFNA